MTKPTAEDELCRQCGQPVTLHGYGSDCRLFVGPSSTAGAEDERAAVVAWLRRLGDGELSNNHYTQQAAQRFAEAIEDGEHHKGKD